MNNGQLIQRTGEENVIRNRNGRTALGIAADSPERSEDPAALRDPTRRGTPKWN